jgi:anthranilate phosphoribosyltransferase
MRVLEGKGTDAMNTVVIVNAAMAIRCIYPEKSMEECLNISKGSLLGGKAFEAFKKIMVPV